MPVRPGLPEQPALPKPYVPKLDEVGVAALITVRFDGWIRKIRYGCLETAINGQMKAGRGWWARFMHPGNLRFNRPLLCRWLDTARLTRSSTATCSNLVGHSKPSWAGGCFYSAHSSLGTTLRLQFALAAHGRIRIEIVIFRNRFFAAHGHAGGFPGTGVSQSRPCASVAGGRLMEGRMLHRFRSPSIIGTQIAECACQFLAGAFCLPMVVSVASGRQGLPPTITFAWTSRPLPPRHGGWSSAPNFSKPSGWSSICFSMLPIEYDRVGPPEEPWREPPLFPVTGGLRPDSRLTEGSRKLEYGCLAGAEQ